MTFARTTAGVNKAEGSGYHLSEVLCTSMADFRSNSAINTSAFFTLIHGSHYCSRGECNDVMASAAESRPGNSVSLEMFSIASSSLSSFLHWLGIISVQ